jgi:hypothetical protein
MPGKHPCHTVFLLSAALILGAALSRCGERRENPTYSEHIAPILHKNCISCHRPGGVAPFPLLTYRDAAKRSKTIRLVTGARIMPPWPADPSYSHFVGEKVLSDEEIRLIQEWVDNGAPVGDSSRIPAPPVFPVGSQLGRPDLVLKMKKPLPIPGDNTDRFMVVKLPFELPADTFIRAIEVVPGNRKLVHHVNGHMIQYDSGAKANVHEGDETADSQVQTFQEAYKKMGILNDDGSYPLLTPSVTNYLPGVIATVYPREVGGYRVKKKGAILLNEIHYGPTPVNDSDQTSVNIFFSSTPPRRPTREIQLGTLGVSDVIPPLVVPPDSIKLFRTEGKILGDVSLLTVNPHMHLLGKSFLAYALKPNGDTIPLIRIRKWDFRWQYFYTFKRPVHLPAGTVIKVEGLFDNTRDNPANPFNPPREIRERNGSMRTTDEMFQFIMTFLPYEPGDENIDLENYSLDK